MGLTFNLGRVSPSVFTDSSLNVGIGAAPSGTYKFEVTGTLRGTGSAFDFYTSSGLGTSSASGLMRVITSGTSVGIAIGQSNSTRYTAIAANDYKIYNDDFFMCTNGAFPLSLGTNNTARLTISSTGLATFSNSIVLSATGYVGFGGGTNYIEGDNPNNILKFGTNNVERMRITSGGDVLVNKTSATNTGKFELDYSRNINIGMNINDTTATSGCGHIYFQRGGTNVGSITSPNNSSTAFNTSSDYRLKEDLQEINGLEKALAIKVYNFKWKNEQDRSDGVLAHELAEILPYAVNGEKDAIDEKDNIIPQGVDYSKIVPILIKAIQEQQAQIQNLQEQNQDLKSRLDKAGL